jgi:hypothetical protein
MALLILKLQDCDVAAPKHTNSVKIRTDLKTKGFMEMGFMGLYTSKCSLTPPPFKKNPVNLDLSGTGLDETREPVDHTS